MSVNRVAMMLGTNGVPRDDKTARTLDKVLRDGGGLLIDAFEAAHPGEQAWLLVLDLQEWIVQELAGMLPECFAGADQVLARAQKRKSTPLWVSVCDSRAGAAVATFLAENEQHMQATCDQARGEHALAICLAHGHMVMARIGPRAEPGALAAAERARRAERSRRAGR